MIIETLVFYFGYFSLVFLMVTAPLFVYTIINFNKHPVLKDKIPRNSRLKAAFIIGGLRLIVAMTLGTYFYQLMMIEVRTDEIVVKAAVDGALMFVMSVVSMYSTIIYPLRKTVEENERQAAYLVNKRKEHRKRYFKYSKEKELEQRMFEKESKENEA